MIWSSLFLICIVQGLFLISIIAYRSSRNPVASRLIITLLVLILFTNLAYIVIRTNLRYYVPQLFGIAFGTLWLFGPLLYLYSRSVIDISFRWKRKYWLHFIPYLFQLYINAPLLLMGRNNWEWYISSFLAGDSQVRVTEKITFAIQDLQLFFYLFLIYNLIRSAKNNYGNSQYIIPLSSRVKWLKQLSLCFLFFLIALFSSYIFILSSGRYHPVTNYIYTLITSGIIYFIAYKLVLNPELLNPDFTQKYKAYMQFAGEEGEKYLRKLKSLMTESKIFTSPDLKLSILAERVGLPSHQVSKLINEKFKKSYNDFVNEYRVQEFIRRINHADFKSYSIYGIALDVGFSSKSTFNTAFKKITGKNPSEYKSAP